ncbi:SURF1 family-domain-containing protein [Gigaspora rosea]|uniref:SURF1-like protein n=1 Tax=Gigaspora rosea TaxID=44941 RepID=A0A397VCB2_9GLOM|nr:SURF1 family-domain-containing protein [Gigaspora rosea]
MLRNGKTIKTFISTNFTRGFCLGTWQVQRLRWKVGLIEEYEERLSKPPMILPKNIKTTVLVKRGWISKDKAGLSTRKNNQFEEIVNVEGVLKSPEKKHWFTPKNNPNRNEWLWTDLETMAEITGAQPVLIEQNLEGSPYLINQMIEDGIPVGKIPSIDLRNTHLQYAITWYSLSIATSVMFYILMKKPPTGHFKRKVMQG